MLADGLLIQIDDIYSIKLLGTSWFVYVAHAANELYAAAAYAAAVGVGEKKSIHLPIAILFKTI